ncbi:MAG: hypothetical protein A3F72_01535 [Bacteroidetes bacterium RIFCSPLOWO2_12_FULL_35_15]|nr:MAG: hypothetical protein A3F72_01535 [Bacteroidetes bacterium RIFCSPLOWO2_12_FULL_35_15]
MEEINKTKSRWDLFISDKWVTAALILAFLGIVVIVFPWNTLEGKSLFGTNYFFKTSEYGALGDFISGISSPLLGAATIILLVRTYTLQKEELAKTRESLDQQMKMLKIQRFEDNFFKLLENHHRIVEAMDLHEKDEKGKKNTISVKRDCFRTFHNHIASGVKKKKSKMVADNKDEFIIDELNAIYDETQNFYKADLHHYFRFIYHILKFVKNATEIDDDDKYKYTSILRATLSPYELALIFYNCLHEFGDSHFKPLVEEFSFLKNLDRTLLFIPAQEDDYDKLAFASSEKRPGLLLIWKNAQKIQCGN